MGHRTRNQVLEPPSASQEHLQLALVQAMSSGFGRNKTGESHSLLPGGRIHAWGDAARVKDQRPYSGDHSANSETVLISHAPFFPHPLKTEVTQMSGEPICETSGHFDIKAVPQQIVELAYRLSNSWTNSFG